MCTRKGKKVKRVSNIAAVFKGSTQGLPDSLEAGGYCVPLVR